MTLVFFLVCIPVMLILPVVCLWWTFKEIILGKPL